MAADHYFSLILSYFCLLQALVNVSPPFCSPVTTLQAMAPHSCLRRRQVVLPLSSGRPMQSVHRGRWSVSWLASIRPSTFDLCPPSQSRGSLNTKKIRKSGFTYSIVMLKVLLLRSMPVKRPHKQWTKWMCSSNPNTCVFISWVNWNMMIFPVLLSSDITWTCVRESTVDYPGVQKQRPCVDRHHQDRSRHWAGFTHRKWATRVGEQVRRVSEQLIFFLSLEIVINVNIYLIVNNWCSLYLLNKVNNYNYTFVQYVVFLFASIKCLWLSSCR